MYVLAFVLVCRVIVCVAFIDVLCWFVFWWLCVSLFLFKGGSEIVFMSRAVIDVVCVYRCVVVLVFCLLSA